MPKSASPSQFKKLTKADIPRDFPRVMKDLVMLAMDAGGEGRVSAKGHIIIRNSKKQTMAIGKNLERRALENSTADFKRLFPDSSDQVSVTTEPTEKMCKTCKHHKPLDEFYRNTTGKPFSECKECSKIRNKANRERHKAEAAKETKKLERQEKAEAQRPVRISPPPETIWKPEDVLTKMTALIDAETAKELTRLRQENHELRSKLAEIHRDTAKWQS